MTLMLSVPPQRVKSRIRPFLSVSVSSSLPLPLSLLSSLRPSLPLSPSPSLPPFHPLSEFCQMYSRDDRKTGSIHRICLWVLKVKNEISTALYTCLWRIHLVREQFRIHMLIYNSMYVLIIQHYAKCRISIRKLYLRSSQYYLKIKPFFLCIYIWIRIIKHTWRRKILYF